MLAIIVPWITENNYYLMTNNNIFQLFSRLGAKERLGDLNMPLFSGAAELLPGDVVEFCGSEGTGKSELLMNIAAVCILPKSWHGVMLPGRNVEIVFVSTDYKLDLVRLVSIMEGISRSHGVPSIPEMKFNRLISSSLERLHVLNCNSMEELILTLYSLNTFLKNHPNVCMLVIDNITTFWWTEKAANLVSDGEQRRWTCALSELVREHHLVVIAARPLITQEVTSAEEKVRHYLLGSSVKG